MESTSIVRSRTCRALTQLRRTLPLNSSTIRISSVILTIHLQRPPIMCTKAMLKMLLNRNLSLKMTNLTFSKHWMTRCCPRTISTKFQRDWIATISTEESRVYTNMISPFNAFRTKNSDWSSAIRFGTRILTKINVLITSNAFKGRSRILNRRRFQISKCKPKTPIVLSKLILSIRTN